MYHLDLCLYNISNQNTLLFDCCVSFADLPSPRHGALEGDWCTKLISIALVGRDRDTKPLEHLQLLYVVEQRVHRQDSLQERVEIGLMAKVIVVIEVNLGVSHDKGVGHSGSLKRD